MNFTSAWRPILSWNKTADFDHVLNSKTLTSFNNRYAKTNMVSSFIEDISDYLSDPDSTGNLLIVGPPGCGKTSFFYFLEKNETSKQYKVLNNYIFYILHINRVWDPNTNHVDREALEEEIFNAWHKFFKLNDLEEKAISITRAGISRRRKLNRFMNYYKDHSDHFKKTLILVVDDVDQIKDGSILVNIANEITRPIEITKVKKWLGIRPNVFNKYSYLERQELETKYNTPWEFPKLEFHELVNHRVLNTTDSLEPKNPFSEVLCDILSKKIYEGDFRRSFSMLTTMLRKTDPKKIKEYTSEEYLQNFFNKNAINIYVEQSIFPNIFDPSSRSSFFIPIEMEILKLSDFYSRNDRLLRLIIDNVLAHKRNKNKKLQVLIKEDFIHKAINDDIEAALKFLSAESLIEIDSTQIKLTGRGQLLAQHSDREHYQNAMMSLLNINKKDTADDVFWNYVFTDANYRECAESVILWRNS